MFVMKVRTSATPHSSHGCISSVRVWCVCVYCGTYDLDLLSLSSQALWVSLESEWWVLLLVSDGLSLVKAPILFFYLHSLILPLWSARRLTTLWFTTFSLRVCQAYLCLCMFFVYLMLVRTLDLLWLLIFLYTTAYCLLQFFECNFYA